MNHKIRAAIAFSGFLAVAFGAFGAHGLKLYLSAYQQLIFEKGVSYQFWHTLAALLAVVISSISVSKNAAVSSYFFLAGNLCFSGSLYLLATIDFTHFPKSIIGPITPLGGFFYLIGWIYLAIALYKLPENRNFQ